MPSAVTSEDDVRLRMSGVRKRFGGVVALDGVDLEVRAGEIHALVGENGAGKSTLMKVLSGAHRPDAGIMRLDGLHYAPAGPIEARRRGIAMIYQELTLAPRLTIEQNIMLGRESRLGGRFGVIRGREAGLRVRSALERLGRPDLDPRRRVSTLGAADRQLVEIARALVEEARIVVFDEPTSSIGRNEVENLFKVVRRLRDEGVAVVYISHFLEEIRALGDRYTVLRDGRSVATGRVPGTRESDLIEAMLGRRVEQLYPESRRVPGEPLLELEGVAGIRLPRRASAVLHRGEILGVGGLVGSGRSELLRLIQGLEPVRSGLIGLAVLAEGRLLDLTRCSPRRALAHGLGLLSEDRKNEGVALRLPIAFNTTLSRLGGGGLASRFGLFRRSALSAATNRMRDRLSIQSTGPWQPAGELSGGNQQKVALARLLHHGCDLLLLDEPTRGVDVGSKAQIYALLDELAGSGTAIITVCSHVPELLGLCDRVAVMHRGELGRARPAADWSEQTVLEAALLGEIGEEAA